MDERDELLRRIITDDPTDTLIDGVLSGETSHITIIDQPMYRTRPEPCVFTPEHRNIWRAIVIYVIIASTVVIYCTLIR